MAKKKEFENRISVSDMDKFMKDFPSGNNNTVTIGATQLEVKPYVDVVILGQIVEDVCNASFDEDGNYMPYIQWYMTRALVVEKYTNIAMPQDMKKRFDLVDYLSSDSFSGGAFKAIYDEIVDAIGHQYYVLLSAIDDKISFEKGKQAREMGAAIVNISNRVRAIGLTVEELVDTLLKLAPESNNGTAQDEVTPDNVKAFSDAIKRIVTDGNAEIGNEINNDKADDE